MARINGEQKALTDVRFKVLGKHIGADRWAALGRMWAVWNECQERGVYTLSSADLDLIHDDIANFADAVVASGLGRRDDDGIYICGTKGRIEWLERKRNAARENGTKGGRPKKTNNGSTENQDGFPGESSPAPALAIAPAFVPAPAVEEKEIAATDARARGVGVNTEIFCRAKVAEIRQNASLMSMAAADPDAYDEAVRTLTGWSPGELADITGDDGIRPLSPRPSRRGRSALMEAM